jgi:hypothetical protein
MFVWGAHKLHAKKATDWEHLLRMSMHAHLPLKGQYEALEAPGIQ